MCGGGEKKKGGWWMGDGSCGGWWLYVSVGVGVGRNMWREEGGGRKTRREGGSRKTDKAKCYDRCIKCNHESYYLNAK